MRAKRAGNLGLRFLFELPFKINEFVGRRHFCRSQQRTVGIDDSDIGNFKAWNSCSHHVPHRINRGRRQAAIGFQHNRCRGISAKRSPVNVLFRHHNVNTGRIDACNHLDGADQFALNCPLVGDILHE